MTINHDCIVLEHIYNLLHGNYTTLQSHAEVPDQLVLHIKNHYNDILMIDIHEGIFYIFIELYMPGSSDLDSLLFRYKQFRIPLDLDDGISKLLLLIARCFYRIEQSILPNSLRTQVTITKLIDDIKNFPVFRDMSIIGKQFMN